MPTHSPTLPDGRLADAPSGRGHWFERDHEWLICRTQTGSVVGSIFLAMIGLILIAIVAVFFYQSRFTGTPSPRLMRAEPWILAMSLPVLLLIVLCLIPILPGERSAAFSRTEVRFTRRFALWSRHRFAPIDQCSNLRVSPLPLWFLSTESQRSMFDRGRVALDIDPDTIKLGPGLSDDQAAAVVHYLTLHFPRLAETDKP
jgi:hypothetical protein